MAGLPNDKVESIMGTVIQSATHGSVKTIILTIPAVVKRIEPWASSSSKGLTSSADLGLPPSSKKSKSSPQKARDDIVHLSSPPSAQNEDEDEAMSVVSTETDKHGGMTGNHGKSAFRASTSSSILQISQQEMNEMLGNILMAENSDILNEIRSLRETVGNLCREIEFMQKSMHTRLASMSYPPTTASTATTTGSSTSNQSTALIRGPSSTASGKIRVTNGAKLPSTVVSTPTLSAAKTTTPKAL